MKRRLIPLALLALAICLAAPSAFAAGEVNLFLGQKEIDLGMPSNFMDGVESQSEFGLITSWGGVDWPVWIAADLFMSNGSDNIGDTFDWDYTYIPGGFVYFYVNGYGGYYLPWGSYYIPPGELDFNLEVEADTMELQVGPRKFWGTEEGRTIGYVGAGLAYTKLDVKSTFDLAIDIDDPLPKQEIPDELRITLLDESPSTIGWWAGGGIKWKLGKGWALGLDLRYSAAEVDLEPKVIKIEADGDSTEIELPEGIKIETASGGVHYGLTFGYRWGKH